MGLEMVMNDPLLSLFLEFKVGRSYLSLREVLQGALYPSERFRHHAAARAIFDSANLDQVKPDFCEVRAPKRHYKISQESLEPGTLFTDWDRLHVCTDRSTQPTMTLV